MALNILILLSVTILKGAETVNSPEVRAPITTPFAGCRVGSACISSKITSGICLSNSECVLPTCGNSDDGLACDASSFTGTCISGKCLSNLCIISNTDIPCYLTSGKKPGVCRSDQCVVATCSEGNGESCAASSTTVGSCVPTLSGVKCAPSTCEKEFELCAHLKAVGLCVTSENSLTCETSRMCSYAAAEGLICYDSAVQAYGQCGSGSCGLTCSTGIDQVAGRACKEFGSVPYGQCAWVGTETVCGQAAQDCKVQSYEVPLRPYLAQQDSTYLNDCNAKGAHIALATAENLYSHTATDGSGAWWEVTFDTVQPLSRITFKNRADCCQARLHGVTLTLLNSSRGVLWQAALAGGLLMYIVDVPITAAVASVRLEKVAPGCEGDDCALAFRDFRVLSRSPPVSPTLEAGQIDINPQWVSQSADVSCNNRAVLALSPYAGTYSSALARGDTTMWWKVVFQHDMVIATVEFRVPPAGQKEFTGASLSLLDFEESELDGAELPSGQASYVKVFAPVAARVVKIQRFCDFQTCQMSIYGFKAYTTKCSQEANLFTSEKLLTVAKPSSSQSCRALCQGQTGCAAYSYTSAVCRIYSSEEKSSPENTWETVTGSCPGDELVLTASMASQSSTLGTNTAGLALGVSTAYSQTDTTFDTWWRVDFATATAVAVVTFGAPSCCLAAMANVTVSTLGPNGETLSTTSLRDGQSSYTLTVRTTINAVLITRVDTTCRGGGCGFALTGFRVYKSVCSKVENTTFPTGGKFFIPDTQPSSAEECYSSCKGCVGYSFVPSACRLWAGAVKASNYSAGFRGVCGCGDGYTEYPERCDDGNGVDGDGCSQCSVDSGYVCKGSPSSCKPICGNGELDIGEHCDDGNTASGDGCSSGCVVEDLYECNGVACSKAQCSTITATRLAPTRAFSTITEATPSKCASACVSSGSCQSYSYTYSECRFYYTNGTIIPDGSPFSTSGYCTQGSCSTVTNALFNGTEYESTYNNSLEACVCQNCFGYQYTQPLCALFAGADIARTSDTNSFAGICADCGNGYKSSGEECDDGNAFSKDGCSGSCKVETGYTCIGYPSICIATVTVNTSAEFCISGSTAGICLPSGQCLAGDCTGVGGRCVHWTDDGWPTGTCRSNGDTLVCAYDECSVALRPCTYNGTVLGVCSQGTCVAANCSEVDTGAACYRNRQVGRCRRTGPTPVCDVTRSASPTATPSSTSTRSLTASLTQTVTQVKSIPAVGCLTTFSELRILQTPFASVRVQCTKPAITCRSAGSGVSGNGIFTSSSSICVAAYALGVGDGAPFMVTALPGGVFGVAGTAHMRVQAVDQQLVYMIGVPSIPSCNATFANSNASFSSIIGVSNVVVCPENCSVTPIAGEGVYSANSALCVAAVHAGAKVPLNATAFYANFTLTAPQSAPPSLRNGILSSGTTQGVVRFIIGTAELPASCVSPIIVPELASCGSPTLGMVCFNGKCTNDAIATTVSGTRSPFLSPIVLTLPTTMIPPTAPTTTTPTTPITILQPFVIPFAAPITSPTVSTLTPSLAPVVMGPLPGPAGGNASSEVEYICPVGKQGALCIMAGAYGVCSAKVPSVCVGRETIASNDCSQFGSDGDNCYLGTTLSVCYRRVCGGTPPAIIQENPDYGRPEYGVKNVSDNARTRDSPVVPSEPVEELFTSSAVGNAFAQASTNMQYLAMLQSLSCTQYGELKNSVFIGGQLSPNLKPCTSSLIIFTIIIVGFALAEIAVLSALTYITTKSLRIKFPMVAHMLLSLFEQSYVQRILEALQLDVGPGVVFGVAYLVTVGLRWWFLWKSVRNDRDHVMYVPSTIRNDGIPVDPVKLTPVLQGLRFALPRNYYIVSLWMKPHKPVFAPFKPVVWWWCIAHTGFIIIFTVICNLPIPCEAKLIVLACLKFLNLIVTVAWRPFRCWVRFTVDTAIMCTFGLWISFTIAQIHTPSMAVHATRTARAMTAMGIIRTCYVVLWAAGWEIYMFLLKKMEKGGSMDKVIIPADRPSIAKKEHEVAPDKEHDPILEQSHPNLDSDSASETARPGASQNTQNPTNGNTAAAKPQDTKNSFDIPGHVATSPTGQQRTPASLEL